MVIPLIANQDLTPMLVHTYLFMSTKVYTILTNSPGTLCIYLIWMKDSSPLPAKQCWFQEEVHAVTEKFFAHNNAKCLRNSPILF